MPELNIPRAHSDSWYDHLATVQEGYFRPWQSSIADKNGEDAFLAQVFEHLQLESRVLEVGCGHGELALDLAPDCESVLAYDRVEAYEWPLPGAERLRAFHPAVTEFLQKATAVDARKRFRDCGQMLEAWEKLLPTARERGPARRRKAVRATRSTRPARDWEALRQREFRQRFGRALGTKHSCRRCDGPVSEPMAHCPWCGDKRKRHDGETSGFPAACPRCRRGVKLDWTYCPWCYGGAIGPLSERSYKDRRYLGRCPDNACGGRPVMPFMRYSPWCRRKLNKVWLVPSHRERCKGCGWGVLSEYWSTCPWCGRACTKTARRARRASGG